MFKNRKDTLGFDDRIMMLFGIPIVGLMVNAILFGEYLREGAFLSFGKCQLMAMYYSAFYWVIFRELHFYFVKKFPSNEENNARYMRLIPLTVILFVVIKFFLAIFIDPIAHEVIPDRSQPHNITEIVSTFLILFLVMTIYETKYLAYKLRLSMIEKEQLVKENIHSQLAGLRNQVNPHFLFNSLNTLSAIIPEDSEKAISFVSKMSKVYRYILEIKDKKIIPLREELDFLHSYTFLLKERFGENIIIDIKVPPQYQELFIVPLSLQITFENAIKHNVISKERPLKIEVFIDEAKKLVVKNNLQKKKVTVNSTQVGLKNISNRYKFFTEKSVDVMATTIDFKVCLPLLKTAT